MILAALGREADTLFPDMALVPLRQGDVVTEYDGPVTHAYFPVSGVLSLVTPLQDGTEVEACLIGRNGMTGAAALHDSGRSFTRDICQVPGEALRTSLETLRQACEASPKMRDLVGAQAVHLFAFASQSVACNARHLLEPRLARWLLTCCDAAESDTIPMTQEFVAIMLGVQRSSLAASAGELRRRGLIETGRGRVSLVDRAGLEGLACECYRITRERTRRLLGPD